MGKTIIDRIASASDVGENELKCDWSIYTRKKVRWLASIDSHSNAQISNLLERASVINILSLE